MSSQNKWRLLVFGATGAIGATVVEYALGQGWNVIGTSRRASTELPHDERMRLICHDPLRDDLGGDLAGEAPFDAVCWAHGANLADSLNDFDAARHLELYEANCLSVLITAASLVKAGLLSPQGARLVIVSSIWQERARQDKLSYAVTKAAVGGIVRSAAIDLGRAGHLVNGILPGVLDTPMTAANLSPDQIDAIKTKTSYDRLPDVGTVAEMILFLCSAQNRSISGQSITVDLGMSNAILI